MNHIQMHCWVPLAPVCNLAESRTPHPRAPRATGTLPAGISQRNVAVHFFILLPSPPLFSYGATGQFFFPPIHRSLSTAVAMPDGGCCQPWGSGTILGNGKGEILLVDGEGREWKEARGGVFGRGLVSAVCPSRRCCRHGARSELQRGLGTEGGEDKEVVAARCLRALERAGAESLAGRACKSEEEGATDMKGDRKFNFDSGRDVIAGGGGEEKHALQPFSTFL